MNGPATYSSSVSDYTNLCYGINSWLYKQVDLSEGFFSSSSLEIIY